MRPLKFLSDVIRHLEDPSVPFLNIIFTFIGAVLLRSCLEQFSTKSDIYLVLNVHFFLLYISLALSLIILFHLAAGEAVDKIARVVLPCFIITIIVPPVDLLLSGGNGYRITYLMPRFDHHLLCDFLFFFGPFNGSGITPGMRIELALVLVMSCCYFYIKTNKLLRSLFFTWLTYTLFFFYAALPFVLKACLNALRLSFTPSLGLLTWFLLFLLLPLSQAFFYLYNKKYFIEIWKDSRMLRISHFLLMVVLGFVVAFDHAVKQPLVLLSWVFIPPAIIFAGIFSIIINNLQDQDIDKVSNKERPSISKAIPLEHYKNMAWIFLGLALIYARAVNFLCLSIIVLWIGNYFLYSSPPLRLKRVPFFSKLVISFNSLLLFGLGYSLPTGEAMISIPRTIIIFFLVFFTAAANFIDIKDYEGDQNAGIKTLPTLWGLKKSKLMIGSFFIMTYSLTWFLVKDIRMLAVMMATGSLIFFLINKKNYSERPVFITYLFSIVVLIAYFWIR